MWKNNIVANTLESPDQLLAHYANPRTHDGKQRDTMRASLDELGIIAPCTVNDRTGNMIDGHMRTEEYLTAGVKEVPVIHLDLSEEDELKAIAYFDAVGTLAGYNTEKLEDLLQQIDFVSEPLENMLTDLLDDKPKALPDGIDDIPEVETPVSKLGDLWLLGNHRVLCGDSTDRPTVERLMDGKKADMVFTDPPYGMEYKGEVFGKKGISNDGAGWKDVTKKALEILPIDNGVVAICFAPSRLKDFFECVEKYDFHRRLTIYKPNRMAKPWRGWIMTMEDIYLFSTGEPTWNSVDHKHDIYTHDYSERPDREVDHPTVKPLSIVVDVIKKTSADKSLIYDGFLGSGSTLIACEQTDRQCYGLELDEHYVDVICKRWQTLTGQMPILESTGEAHDFATSDS